MGCPPFRHCTGSISQSPIYLKLRCFLIGERIMHDNPQGNVKRAEITRLGVRSSFECAILTALPHIL